MSGIACQREGQLTCRIIDISGQQIIAANDHGTTNLNRNLKRIGRRTTGNDRCVVGAGNCHGDITGFITVGRYREDFIDGFACRQGLNISRTVIKRVIPVAIGINCETAMSAICRSSNKATFTGVRINRSQRARSQQVTIFDNIVRS